MRNAVLHRQNRTVDCLTDEFRSQVRRESGLRILLALATSPLVVLFQRFERFANLHLVLLVCGLIDVQFRLFFFFIFCGV